MAEGTRLSRKIRAALESYAAEDLEVRRRFIDALIAARSALVGTDALFSQETRSLLLEAVGMIVIEGVVSGAWDKVHQALELEAPQVYEHIREVIPRGEGRDNPLAL